MVMRAHMVKSRYPWVFSFLLIYHAYRIMLRSSREVYEGQPEVFIDLKLDWTYLLCNTAVLSFHLICTLPIILVIIIQTILEFWRSIKVISGQYRVMRGHMIKNSKKFVTFDILRCSASFLYISMHMFKIAKSWSHQRSMKVSHFYSRLWTYFHCDTAVFSFHLIFNMPVFKCF